MRITCLLGEWQIHHEVVRQCDALPVILHEFLAVRSFIMYGSHLREVVEILGSATEILCRVSCIAEMESPSLVKVFCLSLCLRIA